MRKESAEGLFRQRRITEWSLVLSLVVTKIDERSRKKYSKKNVEIKYGKNLKDNGNQKRKENENLRRSKKKKRINKINCGISVMGK